jgi:plastocyanin
MVLRRDRGGWRLGLLGVTALALAACGGGGGGGRAASAPTTPVAPVRPVVAPAKPVPTGPVHDRAVELRRAADLIEQAQASLDAGNRTGADVLFSTAELLVGPDAVAALAPRFREGAPPRVMDAPIKVADTAPQPAAVGNSEDDEAEETRGTPPPPKPPARGSLSGTLHVAGANGGALALVTLEPVGRGWKPRKAKQRVMEQRARKFAPQLMLIPTGSTVQFPNFDTIFHNVFSTSTPNPFDLGLYRQGEARQVTFAKEGIVRIGCSIHANMAATIVVIDAPHYVIPGGDGAFRFRSLAPGRYKLRAWSEKSKTPITQEVTIAVGDNSVDVGVDGDAPGGPLDDKFGVKRGP